MREKTHSCSRFNRITLSSPAAKNIRLSISENRYYLCPSRLIAEGRRDRHGR
jgi:hypothetical protein